jgi:hypothetical protein
MAFEAGASYPFDRAEENREVVQATTRPDPMDHKTISVSDAPCGHPVIDTGERRRT